MPATNDPMAEIRASFFIECDELLEALQDGLQSLEEEAGDPETINVVFRAVHSIKGGAGAFGLEALVRFAHRFETVLDEVRSGKMHPDTCALKVFFQCADHLSDLVRISRDAGNLPEDITRSLLASLDELLGEEASAGTADADEEIDFQPAALSFDLDFGEDAESLALDGEIGELPAEPVRKYRIRFAPDNELYETGNDPLHMLRALHDMGLCTVTCETGKVPRLKDLSPEASYLSWVIDLASEADLAEVSAAFEFVDGLCTLEFESIETPEAPNPDLPAIDLDSQDEDLQDDTEDTQELAFRVEETTLQASPSFSDADEVPVQEVASAVPLGARQPSAAASKSVVRVDLDRIERLVNLVGELVINQAMLSQSLEQAGLSPHSDAMNGLEEFQRLTRDIQDSVMMIRAQPVKSLFQRMSRIVRESSAAVGKDVRLHTEGETTEVDKTVIERLADPLTHMIRNAVDHGLEKPDVRRRTGKPVQGRVNLTAAHRSGRVIIEVSDDGAGIDRPRVLQKAIEKGLLPTDSTLSDSEIDNLLFLPGFSTASVVSNLSGRGVGMDVVRTAIQSLGGRISIASSPGSGTTFSISLPLTLAVLDGMVVEVAGETLVLPLNVVIETLTLTDANVEMVRPGCLVVKVRNGFVPLFDLGKELGYRAPLDNYDGLVVLLVVNEDGTKAALIIDRILDQRQVVIKGLDDSFYRAPGIAAATILGDGQIALILDTSDIILNAQGTNSAANLHSMTGTAS
jgi:two-component system chemotaxis sensor kinase CheA